MQSLAVLAVRLAGASPAGHCICSKHLRVQACGRSDIRCVICPYLMSAGPRFSLAARSQPAKMSYNLYQVQMARAWAQVGAWRCE